VGAFECAEESDISLLVEQQKVRHLTGKALVNRLVTTCPPPDNAKKFCMWPELYTCLPAGAYDPGRRGEAEEGHPHVKALRRCRQAAHDQGADEDKGADGGGPT